MAAAPMCRGGPRLAGTVHDNRTRMLAHPGPARPRAFHAGIKGRTVDMNDGYQRQQRPLRAAVESQERPVVPTGALRRTSRLAALPLRHAARTAAAATRLSRAATDQVASRTAEQVFATLG